jgi:hypothetical protein
MTWYEADDIEHNPEALRQRARDYHDALLATPGRRAVFMDIMRAEIRNSDDALYQLALYDFVSEIKRKCGINDPLAVLEREAEVSARFEPDVAPREKEDLLEFTK